LSITFPTPPTQLSATQVYDIMQAAAKVALASQTIVVVDRSGDVLGMWGQDPDNATNLIGDTIDVNAADQLLDPDTVGSDQTTLASNSNPEIVNALTPNTAAKYAVIQATARARTAAFFESTQDAFTSRTARYIINPTFPPGVENTESGPLLGVEFSNALGTDALPPGLTSGLAAGLSGDPGGIPLFLNGQPVGAIGVAGDGSDIAPMQSLVPQASVNGMPATNNMPAVYSDPKGAFYNGNEEVDYDEEVALAGAEEVGLVGGKSFMAPNAIQATQIFVNGLRLPFTAEGAATRAPAATATVLTNTGLKPGNTSGLPAQSFFVYGPLIGDTSYLDTLGTAADGLAPLTGGQLTVPNPPVAMMQSPIKTTAFQAGANETIGGILPTSVYPEVQFTLSNGQKMFVYLNNNNPTALGYGVDAGEDTGAPASLAASGITKMPGATSADFGFVVPPTVMGTPSLTLTDIIKVVSQALEEASQTRAAIRNPAEVAMQVYIAVTDTKGDVLAVVSNTDATDFSFDVAVQKARTAAFFSSSTYAFTSRTIGNLADSEFPPALSNGVTGPLYGLQDTLALPQYQGMFTGNPLLGNGITIFPGGAPLYVNETEIVGGKSVSVPVLVGAVGISGDGVDQDDLVAAAASAGFGPPANIEASYLSSTVLVTDIRTSVEKVQTTFNAVPTPTINQLVLLGLDDPDSNNLDKLKLTASDTIFTRIIGSNGLGGRLAAKGVDGVNLPYQKFPRNPGL